MQAAGLRPLLLKGPPVARWLYPDDPAARQYVDVDILVGPTERDSARSVLDRLGFDKRSAELADDVPNHAEQWDRRRDGAAVDLHRTLHGCEELCDEDIWAEATASAQSLEVGGAVVDVPSPVVLTLHAVLHLAANDRPGSQTWLDLSRAIEQVGKGTWLEAADLARRIGVDGEMSAKLRMLSPALAADLGLDAPAPLRMLLLREGSGAPGFGRLAELVGPRAKARYCRQKLFPPRSYLRQSLAIAERGPIGLVIAYVVRSTWGVSRLPMAVTGWLRARSHYRQSAAPANTTGGAPVESSAVHSRRRSALRSPPARPGR